MGLDHLHAGDVLVQSSFELAVPDFVALLNFFEQARLFYPLVHAESRVFQQDNETVDAQTVQNLDNQLS
jgi:hypothetical protein